VTGPQTVEATNPTMLFIHCERKNSPSSQSTPIRLKATIAPPITVAASGCSAGCKYSRPISPISITAPTFASIRSPERLRDIIFGSHDGCSGASSWASI